MPSKKKKYNARFPAGRIKKIMQTDEEVGKVAKAVPVIISRTLELFVESLIKKSVQITIMKNARTLSPHHMKLCILSESRFDFLRELVKSVPEVSSCDDDLSSFGDTPSVSVQLPEGRRSSRDSGGRSTTQEMDIPEQEQPQRQAAPPPQPLPQPPPPSHGLNFYTERDISVAADPAPPILNNDFPARGNPPSYSSNHRSKSLSDNSYDYQSSLINPRGRYSRSHSTNSRDDSIREDYNT